MRKISTRDRRVLLIGGAAAALILAVFYVALPFYESLSQVEGELSQKKRVLTQRIRALRNQVVYEEQNTSLEDELSALRAQLLDGAEGAIAQNQLETIIRGLAEENGVTISRSTPLQERKLGDRYSKVTVQINLQSGMGELASFMHALSLHTKFLQVEEFYLNAFSVRNQIRLQPRLNISGFIRISEG